MTLTALERNGSSPKKPNAQASKTALAVLGQHFGPSDNGHSVALGKLAGLSWIAKD